MKTPYGFECVYFFGDYYRGRNVEECRLIGHLAPPHDWRVPVCKKCPVPGILRANSCANLVLKGKIQTIPFGLNRRMMISAFCTKTDRVVAKPHIGCGECHPLPDVFDKFMK